MPIDPNPTVAKTCRHEQFAASTTVHRIVDGGKITHVAEVKIWCHQCGKIFAFPKDAVPEDASREILFRIEPL